MRIQGIQIAQTESPFEVRCSALKLIVFHFAQEEDIKHFKTTKSQVQRIQHWGGGTTVQKMAV